MCVYGRLGPVVGQILTNNLLSIYVGLFYFNTDTTFVKATLVYLHDEEECTTYIQMS